MPAQESSVGFLSHGIYQLHDTAHRNDPSTGSTTTTEDSGDEEESGNIGTDEDTELFCAYRSYRHGQSRAESLDLLQRMGIAQANDLPWYLDIEQPLGITWSGAEDEDVQYNTLSPTQMSVAPYSSSSSQGQEEPTPAVDLPSHAGQDHNANDPGLGSADFEQLNQEAVSLQTEPDAYMLGNANNVFQDAGIKDVTIGWEIEFLVLLAKGDVTKDIQADGRYFISEEDQSGVEDITEGVPASKRIANILREAGIPAVHTEAPDPVQVITTAAYPPGPEELDLEDPYAVWRVDSEFTCVSKDLDLVGLELSSRKLPADELALAELEQVLCLTRNNVLVSLNKSCSTHVHVDASVLDLNEQRHFVCLYLIVEKVIFSLCHPSRRRSTWCYPVYEISRLASDAKDLIRQGGGQGSDLGGGPHADDMPTRMRLMHRAIHDLDSEQLRRGILQPNVFESRNALNMKLVGQGKYTFEFRHFQGSFDTAVIWHWTRVCLALVMAAKGLGDHRQHPATQVYDVFYRVGCRPEEEAWQCLLRVLDLGDSIAFWELMRSSYASSPGDGGLHAGSHLDSEGQKSAFGYLSRVG